VHSNNSIQLLSRELMSSPRVVCMSR